MFEDIGDDEGSHNFRRHAHRRCMCRQYRVWELTLPVSKSYTVPSNGTSTFGPPPAGQAQHASFICMPCRCRVSVSRPPVKNAPSAMTFALLSGNSNAVELASEQYTRPSGSRYTTIACLLPGMMTDLIILPSCTTLACVSPRCSPANCSTDYQRPGHCCAAPESPMHQQHCTSLLLDPFPACPFWPADSSTHTVRQAGRRIDMAGLHCAACKSHRLSRSKPLLRLHRLLLPCSARSEELLLMHRARLQQPGLVVRRCGPTCRRLTTVSAGCAEMLIKILQLQLL